MVDFAGMVGKIMRMFTILKANIKRQRVSFIGVLILILIVTMSLCAVVSVWYNANTYVEQELERIGYGDVTSWISGTDHVEELKQDIISHPDIGDVQDQPVLYFQTIKIHETEAEGSSMILQYVPKEYDYHIFNETLHGWMVQAELKEHEIYVPVSAISLYDASIGDQVELHVGSKTLHYTIKGYFEDPIMGSSVMGMKGFLINEQAFQALVQLNEQEQSDSVVAGYMLHITQAEHSSLSLSEFRNLVNETSTYAERTVFTYAKETMIGFMMVLQNIFAGFLLLFVVVLLVVAMLVLGHSISSSIEQDYVNMGILKAIGFTQRRLRLLHIVQNLAAILIGMLAGVPISIAVVQVVNQITLTTTGILIPSTLPLFLCVLFLAMIMGVLLLFIVWKTRKIAKITPIKAIRGGSDDVYFKSRLTLPIYKHGLSGWLALRQLTSSKKQYISACLVSALLVFFLSLMGRMSAWMGEDGQGLKDAFASASYDIGVRAEDDKTLKEAEALIASYSPITEQYYFMNVKGQLNHTDYIMNVISEPERYHITKGRTARYENEIVVTEIVAQEQQLHIGDEVSINYGGKEQTFIIVGFNQSANDMGANFSINRLGYERLSTDQDHFYTYYKIKDRTKVAEISQALTQKFHERIAIDDNVWSGLESAVMAMDAFEYLLYGIVIFFVLVVIVLTGSKILYKEQHDLGVYKSLGFASHRLRCSFALRFGAVAFLGSGLGIVLSAWLSDPLATSLLRFAGISEFKSHLDLIGLVAPGLIVMSLFMFFAYAIAGRIKKVSPNILIDE